MSLVPLSEWGGINLHNTGFDKSLGSDQFIVAGIVDDVNDTRLSCDSLWSPSEVPWFQTKGSVFFVATHCPHRVNSAVSQLHTLIWIWAFIELWISLELLNLIFYSSLFSRLEIQCIQLYYESNCHLGVSSWTTQFKLSLLADLGHTPTRLPPLVPFITRYTCNSKHQTRVTLDYLAFLITHNHTYKLDLRKTGYQIQISCIYN